MNNNGEGLIIFIKKIKDNDIYLRILSNNDEIISGMVYGGNSSKKKSIYQLGYYLDYSTIQKNENAPPSINGEIIEPYLGTIIENKFKSYALLSIISIVNTSIIEGQKVPRIYKITKDVINYICAQKHWLSFFCIWLFDLLEVIGYQIEYKNKMNFKFFDLLTHEFQVKSNNDNTIAFPHNLLSNKGKIDYKEIIAFFSIFEDVFIKNHLNNINIKIPINYMNFRNIIIKEIKNFSNV